MKMNKMFAGLVAFAAGVALSAGSAFATNGYVTGDHAPTKLVPYYDTGDNRATIIGIQNLSPQEMDTMTKNNLVTDLKNFLAGQMVTADAADAIVAIGMENVTVDAGAMLDEGDLNTKAAAEMALEKAEEAAYTEHLYVSVKAYDTMGKMMGDPTYLCLAEHQFGFVILQGPAMQASQESIDLRSAILTVSDGHIEKRGYVMVEAEKRKFTACRAVPPNLRRTVDTGLDVNEMPNDAASMLATWAIVQDVGMGFFGTEVPNASIMMTEKDDGMMVPNCYDASDVFAMSMCGLIPERHDNSRDADSGDLDRTGAEGGATAPTNVIARYDAGDDSSVVVWLAAGMDGMDARPTQRRTLDVVVKCEDGSVKMANDDDGMPTRPAKVPAPGMVTMIDPTMGVVGELTDQCDGDRGVLKITMPDGSHAGMVFSHISQAADSFRMNFIGYSKADPMPLAAP